VFGGRAPLGEFAVAGQRNHEEGRKVDRDLRQNVVRDPQHQGGDEGDEKERLRQQHHAMGNDRARLEHDDEGGEIKRERHDPHQRHGADIGGDMRRHRDQEAGGHRGKDHPGNGATGRRRRGSLLRLARRTGAPCAHEHDPAGGHQQDENAEQDRPGAALVGETGQRLDRERI
jgi:hypothetical protein